VVRVVLSLVLVVPYPIRYFTLWTVSDQTVNSRQQTANQT
jgi:hypothetical protein